MNSEPTVSEQDPDLFNLVRAMAMAQMLGCRVYGVLKASVGSKDGCCWLSLAQFALLEPEAQRRWALSPSTK